MSGLLLVSCLDVGRFFGRDPLRASVGDVSDRISELYLRRSGGGFNHNVVISSAQNVFSGAITAEEGIAICSTNGNPKGRVQNTAIAKAVLPYAEANLSRCHRIGFTAIVVGRYRGKSIYVGVKAPFVRVNGENSLIVLPGFRKSSRPLGREIDLACSFAANQLARDDYETADIEYLMAGPGSGQFERVLQVLHGREMNLFSSEELDSILRTYVSAVVRHLDRGEGLRPAHLYGYRIIDPSAPRFV